MPLQKTRYVITTASSYLCGLKNGEPILSMDPLDAWRADLMWSAKDVAILRLKMVQDMFPELTWSLAAVTLACKDLHNWQAVSVVHYDP